MDQLLHGRQTQRGDYENDKELLIDFYNSKGYRNATIVSDSIYPINEKRLGIDIDVSEGNKYYIRNVSWVGNSVYETDDLQRMFSVKKGDTYDKKSMHKRLGIGKEENLEDMSVKSLYQNEGYLMSQIEPAEVIIAPTRSTSKSRCSKASSSPSTKSASRATSASMTR
ncbi:MAG: POTRA domain-containing protein [Alistipes shahii]|uniref:POTRA domain-containing protein n=1 Tax=Alistipes shahii TaxID=328814 RepID=UPI00399CB714